MKFGQLVDYNKRNVFFSNIMREIRKAGRLVPDLFLFFKKPLYEVEAIGLQLSFNIFR